MTDLAQLDPHWAWAAYEPDGRRLWDARLAAHLYRRAGFGANWGQLQEAEKLGPSQTLDRIFQPAAAPIDAPDLAGFNRNMEDLGGSMGKTGDPRSLSGWWLYRMLFTPDPLAETLTLFWHNHFATSAAKVTTARLMLDQHDLLRRHAMGPFEPLVLAISRDPAMLIWLDSTTNRRIHPNENYARELMELFCLGPGNYTEGDIKEVARAFTGWEVQQRQEQTQFRFNKHQHDEGDKTFLGRTGNFGGEDAVRIVLEQPAAARFIATKLVRCFVAEDPELPPALVEPLAVQLRGNGFTIGPVVRTILSSNLFFSDHAVGRKVRSPVELGIGLMRSLEMTGNLQYLATALDNLGQAVFFPPNVKGWDGGRTWISSASLLARANLVRDLLLGGQARFAGPALPEQLKRNGAADPAAAIDHLLTLLVAVPVPDAAKPPLIELANSDPSYAKVVAAIGAMPEFQLS